MEKVTFISARYENTLLYGVAIDFRIKYINENKNLLRSKTLDCWFKVILTRFALIEWGLYETLETEKLTKLAFPFAVKWISERVKNGTLKEIEEKSISPEDKISPYPFDKEKINKIEGHEIEFLENNIAKSVNGNKYYNSFNQFD